MRYRPSNPVQPVLLKERYEIDSSKRVYELLKWLKDEPQEHLISISINHQNEVLGYEVVHKGTGDTSLACPACIFRPAIKFGATGILIVHNHPSGTTNPSPEDIAVTERMISAGNILNIPVLDHVIIGTLWHSIRTSHLYLWDAQSR